MQPNPIVFECPHCGGPITVPPDMAVTEVVIAKRDIAVNEPIFEGVDVEPRPSVGFFNPPRSDI